MQLMEIFLIVGIANFLGGILSILSCFFIKIRYKNAKKIEKGEKASIIIPLKEKRIENIKYFLNQLYKNYEIIVVVDTKEEASLLKNEYGDKIKVKITNFLPTCSGKISALLTGIKEAKGNIYVFADADIKPHKNWLSYLIANLNKNVSTTYRWYFKNPILSTWNAATAAILFYDIFNFAWGGAMAIKKEFFEELEIKKRWENEIVDDLTLTTEVKKRGYKIRFVPQAISEADEEMDIFSWMNKQIVWVKYYFPSLWKLAFFLNTGMRLSNVAGFFILYFHPLIGFLLISPIIFDFIRGWQEYDTFISLMEYEKEKFLPWYFYSIYRPLISFIISYNLFSSAFIREIKWGKRKYIIYKRHVDTIKNES